MEPNEITKKIIRNFYDYLNLGRKPYLKINCPVKNDIVLSKDYFDFDLKMTNFANGESFESVNHERLPEEVSGVYSLINNQRLNQENINLSFRAFIEINELEEILKDEIPSLKSKKAKSSIEYFEGDKKILEIGRGLRRLIFFPEKIEAEGKTNFIPYAESEKVVDLIYEHEPFIKNVPSGMTVLLNVKSEIEMIPRQKLTIEAMKMEKRIFMTKLLKANNKEVENMVSKFKKGKKF